MKRGTIGDNSKEGENEDGMRLEVGVGVGVGVGVAVNINSEGDVEPIWPDESDTNTKLDCPVCVAGLDVAGFGAIGRCFEGWGWVGGASP